MIHVFYTFLVAGGGAAESHVARVPSQYLSRVLIAAKMSQLQQCKKKIPLLLSANRIHEYLSGFRAGSVLEYK